VPNPPAAITEREHQVLATARHAADRGPDQLGRLGADRLEAAEAEQVRALEARAGERRVEALGEGLHLWQFGHGVLLVQYVLDARRLHARPPPIGAAQPH